MIFFWLIQAIRKMIWYVQIPRLQDVAKIDPNAQCPVCGNRAGRIRCVWQQQQDGPKPPKNEPTLAMRNMKVLAQHTCDECGARWFEKPIADVDPSRVMPGAPRTELEKAEDRTAMLQAQN